MRAIKLRLVALVILAGLIATSIVLRHGDATVVNVVAAFVAGWGLRGTFHDAAKYTSTPEDAA